MIERIKCLLFQLHDVSEYICFLSEPSILGLDYSWYSSVLSCACLEEKYVMMELENALNSLFGLRKRWFSNNTWRVRYDDDLNWYYYFRMPRGLNKSSREFIMLRDVMESVKKETRDIDVYTCQLGLDKWTRLFRLQCLHHDFYTNKWLRDKNVEVEFI